MHCQFCNREIKNKGSLASHSMVCSQNPNKVSHKHSPNAGVQKGNIPWNSGATIGRQAHWDEKFPLDEVLVENSSYARHSVKARILAHNLIDYQCACCGIGPEWQGNPMVLILDHINGINNDNRIENLRFVCSNCDSQLPTYKSRNKKGRPIQLAMEPVLKTVED